MFKSIEIGYCFARSAIPVTVIGLALSSTAFAQNNSNTLQQVLEQAVQPRQTSVTDAITNQVAQQAVSNQLNQRAQGTAANHSGFMGGVFSCSAHGQKQIIGAAVGGVAGGVLGNVILSKNRTLGTLGGAALGAAAGSAIGCKLQKNDQAKAERAAQQALLTNRAQTWRNAESGAYGTASVTSSGGISGLSFANGVQPATSYTSVGATYTASTAGAAVRSAPRKTASVLTKLDPNQSFYVPAGVKGAPWLLYAQDGIAEGYVATTTVHRAPATAVAAGGGCKIVKNTVNAPGEAAQVQSLKACKGSNGQWVMTEA